MSAARNPYPARPFRRTRTRVAQCEDRSKYGGGPERNGGANSDGAPPRHEDRAGDRFAPTRAGRQVGRAHRRHGVVTPYRTSRADRPSPSRLRRPPGAWRNRPRLGHRAVGAAGDGPKSLTRRPINSRRMDGPPPAVPATGRWSSSAPWWTPCVALSKSRTPWSSATRASAGRGRRERVERTRTFGRLPFRQLPGQEFEDGHFGNDELRALPHKHPCLLSRACREFSLT